MAPGTLAQATGFFANGGALFAAGALATAVPIAIHLLTRLRRQPVPWGAMRFLLEIHRRHRTRLQLEQWLLLAVRCLVLVLLGLALAGPQLVGLASAGGVQNKTLVLVLDDSLSTRARTAGEVRFEKLRTLAIKMLGGLGPTDRVAVVLAATPAKELLPLTQDRAAARQALATAQPRFSRSDLPAALGRAADALQAGKTPADRSVVALLSDFSAGTLPAESPASELARVGKLARIVATKPAADTANTQIASLVPQRHMLVIAGQDAASVSLPLQLVLRRFESDLSSGRSTAVDITLQLASAAEAGAPGAPSAGSKPAGATTGLRREYIWSAGQDVASLNMDLPMESLAPVLAAAPAGQALQLLVQASVADDPLQEDNHRAVLIEVRPKLTVGLVDQDRAAGAEDGGLRPRQWLEAALSVGRCDVLPLSLTELDEKQLAAVDAVIVLRPDLLGDQELAALRARVERGMLLMLTAPAKSENTQWTQRLEQGLTLPWTLAAEARSYDGAGLALDAERAVPAALQLLAADWAALLRPVRVQRSLELTPRLAGDAPWISLAGTQPGALMHAAPLGDGHVIMLATALEAGWTNLPAKPLFVPLINETLRGVLGGGGEAARLASVLCGQRPVLGTAWDSSQPLVRVPGTLQRDPTPHELPLTRITGGVTPEQALDWPGLYTLKQSPGRRLVVNVDAYAGNTRMLDESRWRDWLDALGSWQVLDEESPLSSLQASTAPRAVGWHVLWLVLALAVLELALARWFSHARRQAIDARPVADLLRGGLP